MVVAQAEAMLGEIDSRRVEYAISGSLLSPVGGLLLRLSQVPIADSSQAEDFLARLDRIPAFVDAVVQRHREGVEAGRVPLSHLVQDAVDHPGVG